MEENIKSLMLEDETFENIRQNFNTVLQRLFKNMIDSGSDEGSITLKIDVTLQEEYIKNFDPDIEGESRLIRKPSFEHKVTSTVSVKDEIKGKRNSEMELVWNEDLQAYVLAYISNTQQRSIFDKDFQESMKSSQPEVDALDTDSEKEWMNVPVLPGEVSDENALPGEAQEGGYIDRDFREVDDSQEDEDDEDGYGYEEPENED